MVAGVVAGMVAVRAQFRSGSWRLHCDTVLPGTLTAHRHQNTTEPFQKVNYRERKTSGSRSRALYQLECKIPCAVISMANKPKNPIGRHV